MKMISECRQGKCENERRAIRTHTAADDATEAKLYDLSAINMERLRDEFARKVKRKATAVEDLRALMERKLELMMRSNPERMDYYRKYSEIVADYNREKDRVTIEETFARLVDLLAKLNEEQRRAAEEGLTEDELAIFDLLKKEKLTQKQRDTVKAASKHLLAKVLEAVASRHDWTGKEETKADVEVLIQTEVFTLMPTPPFDEDEKLALAERVYQHVFQQSSAGEFGAQAAGHMRADVAWPFLFLGQDGRGSDAQRVLTVRPAQRVGMAGELFVAAYELLPRLHDLRK